ncbi:MAG: hypothetical protein LIP10_03570 [Clostridiales bacterium]|nr:hypothetical protein [Clostridiales bacterium]
MECEVRVLGRAERRKAERRARIEDNKQTVRMHKSDINKLKDDVREEVSMYSVDMLLTCIGLAEHRLYGFGPTRIMRTLNYIDQLMGDINSDVCTMPEYVEALKEETGIVIRSEGRKIG